MLAAHVEVELAGSEQDAVVGLRTALHDRHVEAVFGVGAVRDGLIIAAMLGLGEPVGAERDLVGGEAPKSPLCQRPAASQTPVSFIICSVPRRLAESASNSGAIIILACAAGKG